MGENKKSLLAKLSDDDLMHLEEGKKSGASREEQDRAAAILEKFSGEKILTTQRKRGPKPASTNSTEEEIRLRIAWIRLMLGPAATSLTYLQLLSALLLIVNTYKSKCSKGLYSNAEERTHLLHLTGSLGETSSRQIYSYLFNECGSLGPSFRPPPSEDEINDFLEAMHDAALNTEKKVSWHEFVEASLASMPSSPINDENAIYRTIAETLGIARQQDARSSNDPEVDKWINKMFTPQSRNKILGASTGMLLRMRSVIDECQLIQLSSGVEYLYILTRSISHSFEVDRDLPFVIAQLDTFFIAMTERQFFSPFVPLVSEEMDPTPPKIPEDGQIFGGI